MSRATAAERARLRDDFVRLCEIPSPSFRERAAADFVAGELRAAGLHVSEDASASSSIGSFGRISSMISWSRIATYARSASEAPGSSTSGAAVITKAS